MAIGHAGQVALLDDRGAEARLGEHHHPRRRLQQMRAGARADDEEKRILQLAVKPDDPGEAAEHLALATFAQHRRAVDRAAGQGSGVQRVGERQDAHAATVRIGWGEAPPAAWSRARRSFQMNCPAFTT